MKLTEGQKVYCICAYLREYGGWHTRLDIARAMSYRDARPITALLGELSAMGRIRVRQGRAANGAMRYEYSASEQTGSVLEALGDE